MTSWTPPDGPPPEVRVGLGHSNAVVAIAVLVFCGGIAVVSGYGAATADYFLTRVVSLGFAVAFAIPVVMVLFRLPQLFRQGYLILDPGGMRFEHGKHRAAIPWQQLVAVGIGYALAAPGQRVNVTSPVELVSHHLADHAAEALKVSDKRQLMLEIYPVRHDANDSLPQLRRFWKALPAPMPQVQLPPYGWRFPLPPVVETAQSVDQGITTFAPRHRLGWYLRAWSK